MAKEPDFSGVPEQCHFGGKRVFTQMTISKKCPLCWAPTMLGVIKHLKVDHHRTEIEALALMERSAQGTLGWEPELKKKRAALRTSRIGN